LVPVYGKSTLEAVAVAFSMAWLGDAVQAGFGEDRALGMLAGFRGELYRCLGKRRDALSGLADAVLCKQDRVHMLAELSPRGPHLAGVPAPPRYRTHFQVLQAGARLDPASPSCAIRLPPTGGPG
jgi:hypothetical protein